MSRETSRTYRVGIIGFGGIGKVHAWAYQSLPYFYAPAPLRACVTHICAAHDASANAGAALTGAANAVTDFRRITENPDVDIVHICTPNRLHAEPLLSAIAHQKHIYCDKPLTATLAEAEAVTRALPDYQATAQMTLQNRFFPAVMRARQLVEAGAVGRVLQFRACHLHAGSANPAAPLKWKLRSEEGGGVIADLGSHLLDLTDWLAGEIVALQAVTGIAYPERPAVDDPARRSPVTAEDAALMLARLRDGGIGTLEATKVATGTEDEVRIEIHGTNGALRYNGMDPHHLEYYNAAADDRPAGGFKGWTRIDTGQRYPVPAAAFPGPKFAIGWLRAHVACLANFLMDVAAGRPGNPGLERGVRIQRLMECARTAARSGQWTQADAL